MKKINHKKIIILSLSILFLFSFLSITYAADNQTCDPKTGTTTDNKACYVSLEPNAFPGVTNTGSLTSFLSTIFSFGIAAAVALALIMIIWGGIIKMTTDSWMGKSDANSKIQNAAYGLGLALISWLLLYTINPCLVQFTATSGGCTATNQLLN